MFCDAFSPQLLSFVVTRAWEVQEMRWTSRQEVPRLLFHKDLLPGSWETVLERGRTESTVLTKTFLYFRLHISLEPWAALNFLKCLPYWLLLLGKMACACSWLGEECMLVIIRDPSQMSMESKLCIFTASVSTPTPSQLSRYVPTIKMKCMITDWKWKYEGRKECEIKGLQILKTLAGVVPVICQHLGNM